MTMAEACMHPGIEWHASLPKHFKMAVQALHRMEEAMAESTSGWGAPFIADSGIIEDLEVRQPEATILPALADQCQMST